MRVYNPDDKLWLNFEAPIQIPQKQFVTPTLEDELLIHKLSKTKQSKAIWELYIAYMGIIINDKEYDRPADGRICILAERKSGMALNQDMLSPYLN